ncbi:hypothetical protein HYT26_02495 [Candidatus Pacearchaeota archaeon]|nr:hypothetical protein [Candidatus Pacearchaeota archaeon]
MVEIIKADYIMGFAMLLLFATHSAMQFIAIKYQTYAQEQKQAEVMLRVIEQNPVAVKIFNFDKLKYVYSFFFAPSVLFAYYYYLRSKWLAKNKDFLTSISIFFMVFTLSNFLNDFSYLMGLLAR